MLFSKLLPPRVRTTSKSTGLGCAVDNSVALYHLERQSQGDGESWRANATLFNAWRFNRRWGQTIGVDLHDA